jgi:hypothetical protein
VHASTSAGLSLGEHIMAGVQRVDSVLRGAGRGITTVVLAAGGYTLMLLALAWLTAWIVRAV